MNSFEAYNLFHALKLHFQSEIYDFFKFHGKVNITIRGFNQRKDIYYYEKLAAQKDPKGLILANIIDGNISEWIGNILTLPECQAIYKKWKSRQESLGYVFKNEIDKFVSDDFDSNFKITSTTYPLAFQQFIEGQLSYETLIIINDLVGFLPYWYRKMKGDVVFDAFELKMRKYIPLFNLKKNDIKNF